MVTNKETGERVAMKRIPKKLASREDFQREMEALLRIQKWGGESTESPVRHERLVLNRSIHENAWIQGHPHICALHEHFDEGGKEECVSRECTLLPGSQLSATRILLFDSRLG